MSVFLANLVGYDPDLLREADLSLRLVALCRRHEERHERGVSKSSAYFGLVRSVVSHFAGRRFWVHVDADVLDPQWMQAVDSPDPGGMSPEELLTTLEIALAAEECEGTEVTIYDPTLDSSGEGASLLVDLLVTIL